MGKHSNLLKFVWTDLMCLKRERFRPEVLKGQRVQFQFVVFLGCCAVFFGFLFGNSIALKFLVCFKPYLGLYIKITKKEQILYAIELPP